MASEEGKAAFLGLTMVCRLVVPPITIRGTVNDIVPGQSLTLVNVWGENGQWQSGLTIEASNIADIYQQPAPAANPAQAYPTPSPLTAAPTFSPVVSPPAAVIPASSSQVASKTTSQTAFIDPAIVSVGKPPRATTSQHTSRPPSSEAAVAPTANFEHLKPHPSVAAMAAKNAAAIIRSMQEVSLDGKDAVETTHLDATHEEHNQQRGAVEQESQPATHKKRRRQRQPRNARGPAAEGGVETSPLKGTQALARGKGWRQTPILLQEQDVSSFQPYTSLKRQNRKGKDQATNENGWASEDVTDVQEMGDFDFEGSLAKFDKRTIFDEMRKEDKIDEADRLVSHNRQAKPKPGTAGGKNLHYTENVLDLPSTVPKPEKAPPDDFWKSEADDGVLDGGERHSGRELGSSRQSSRRGDSKVPANRRSQSRKASAANVGQGPSRVNSGVIAHDAGRSRPSSRNVDKRQQLPSVPAGSGFYAAGSNRRVEIVSPLQMLNLESIAQNDLGLTEDMMSENAGRGIAEVALHVLYNDPANKVRMAATDGSAALSAPTVVILAGNNKSGFRSIAAGRHLRSKGVNVVVCLAGIEKGERDLSVDMVKQIRLFRNFGGRVCNKSELFEHVRKASIPVISMDAPRSVLPQAPPMAVNLVIDALLGHPQPFDDLRASDQATVYELIEWTNRNAAFVLAVEVPTGIDFTTGKPAIQDGNSLYIRPRYVVSLGAPKKGLYEAVRRGDVDDDETVTGQVTDDAVLDWKLFLVDIGLGQAVWKRAGTKIRRGIDFDNKWALEIKYRPGQAQTED